jgi:hypothetical protein
MSPLSDAISAIFLGIMMDRPFNPYEYSIDDQTLLFLGQDLRERLQ